MESLIQTPEKTEELPSQNTKELSPKSISRISNNLRNDAAIPDQAIFDASAQLLGALNPKAKALFNKILADPLNLSEAIAYLHDLEESEPILTHKDFFKIHDNTEISNKKLLETAQTFREDHGRKFIEANLEDALRAHSNMTKDHFDIVQMKMKIGKKGRDYLCVRGILVKSIYFTSFDFTLSRMKLFEESILENELWERGD